MSPQKKFQGQPNYFVSLSQTIFLRLASQSYIALKWKKYIEVGGLEDAVEKKRQTELKTGIECVYMSIYLRVFM